MNGAIETIYKGCRFRSRLEARWAVFFDAIGVEWKYEEQGYEVDGHRYLPDFWLPGPRVWAEVKGDRDGLRKDFARMSVILGPKSPLPGFVEGKTALVVLGDVPDATSQTILHPVLHRRDAGLLRRTWGFFLPGSPGPHFAYDRQPSWIYVFFGRAESGAGADDAQSTTWNVEVWPLDGNGCWTRVNEAYRAARRARFEHGELGGLPA